MNDKLGSIEVSAAWFWFLPIIYKRLEKQIENLEF